MFVRNDLAREARVLKEARALLDAGHAVTIVAKARDETPELAERGRVDGIEVIRVPVPNWRRWWRWVRSPWRLWDRLRGRRRRPGDRLDTLDWLAAWRFGNLGWARRAAAAAPTADVYHGHDLTGLPAAVQAADLNGGRVVYDSHEAFLDSGATFGRSRIALGWLRRLERRNARRAIALVTVNRALADYLGAQVGIGQVVVVHNCPARPAPERLAALQDPATYPRNDRIRRALDLPPGTPIVLYHGGFRSSRGLRELAEAFARPELSSAHLVFMGFGPLRADIDALAAEARFGGRIHLIPPVAPAHVVDWVASADVAAMALQPDHLNYWLSTPNKLFEALAAGVPVAASAFPGITGVLLDDPVGPLGAVFDPRDPGAIAHAIAGLLDGSESDRTDIRIRCLSAARDRWNWETEVGRLVALYAELAEAP